MFFHVTMQQYPCIRNLIKIPSFSIKLKNSIVETHTAKYTESLTFTKVFLLIMKSVTKFRNIALKLREFYFLYKLKSSFLSHTTHEYSVNLKNINQFQ